MELNLFFFFLTIIIRVGRWCHLGGLRNPCSIALLNNRPNQTTKCADQTKLLGQIKRTDRLLPGSDRSASGRLRLITTSA